MKWFDDDDDDSEASDVALPLMSNHDPWHVNNDKLECCLPSCFNTSLVFESLGEDMIVVVMKDEMGSSGRELMTSSKMQAGAIGWLGNFWGGGVSPVLQLSN